MFKLLIPLVVLFLSCEKERTVCGTVVAVPDPVYNNDSSKVWYYVALKQNTNGLLRWVEISEEQKNTIVIGDNLCTTF